MKVWKIMYWTFPKRGAYAHKFVFAKNKREAITKADVKNIISVQLA